MWVCVLIDLFFCFVFSLSLICVILCLDWFVALRFCLRSICVGLFSVICYFVFLSFLFINLCRSASWFVEVCIWVICLFVSDWFVHLEWFFKNCLQGCTDQADCIDNWQVLPSFLSVIALGVGGGIYIFSCFFIFWISFFPQVFLFIVLPSTSLWDIFYFFK